MKQDEWYMEGADDLESCQRAERIAEQVAFTRRRLERLKARRERAAREFAPPLARPPLPPGIRLPAKSTRGDWKRNRLALGDEDFFIAQLHGLTLIERAPASSNEWWALRVLRGGQHAKSVYTLSLKTDFSRFARQKDQERFESDHPMAVDWVLKACKLAHADGRLPIAERKRGEDFVRTPAFLKRRRLHP